MDPSGYDEPEVRIAALEKRVQEMNGQVRGLLTELLDIKAVTQAIAREHGGSTVLAYSEDPANEEQSAPETSGPAGMPVADDTKETVVVIPFRGGESRDEQVTLPETEMVRIMQPDGTMKLEPRRGSQNPIDSSGGYGKTQKSTLTRSRQKSR